MEGGQVSHDCIAQIWQRLAGYLVEVVYNLGALDLTWTILQVAYLSLQRCGSEQLHSSFKIVRLQHSEGCSPGFFL